MQDFLLELGFEELPARFVHRVLQQLAENVTQKLKEARLDFGEVRQLSTPRRLTILIKDLQTKQADLVEEVKGPPLNIAQDQEGNLTKAGQGFLRSQGVGAEAILVKQFQGADYIYIRKEVRGQAARDLLKPLLEDVITHLRFPKNMRWDEFELRYARPLRWMVALLGAEVIPLEVGFTKAGQLSYGHRQLSSGAVLIASPDQYEEKLQEHYVLVDPKQRSALIWDQLQFLAQREQAQLVEDQSLLDEIVNLVEYPTAFCGSFSADYLNMPSEVLITSMKEHQRYFPLYNLEGDLICKFIGVRNGADNHLDNVIHGNEKVLEARLADAKFFYDEDLQTNLADNLEKLAGVVFHEKLGSMGAKVKRIEQLTESLAGELGYEDYKKSARRAAMLAKCDLVSQMVYEFPELQGIMGEKYALAQGETKGVSTGIREHYLPRFAGDVLPVSIEGTLVSLADKLDTLVGYFAVGSIPTGSQDPFALRRQAQGVVQILLLGDYDVSLNSLLAQVAENYINSSFGEENHRALVDFLLARLRVLLKEQGYSYDILDAVMATGDDRLPQLLGRVKALTQLIAEARHEDLFIGFERIANLASKAEDVVLRPEFFEAADKKFHQELQSLDVECHKHLAARNYGQMLQVLSEFRLPIDQFFDAVMIMAEDPNVRANRLALLQQAVKLYSLCGDLNLIVANK